MRQLLIPMAPLLLSLVSAAPTFAGEGGMDPMDVMRLRTVRGVFPSPDGTKIAFLRSEPRLSDDSPGGSYTHLWMIEASGGEARLLMGGKKSVRGVAWSPDGQWITFVEKREGDDHSQVYGLPMNGGEPTRLTETERGVSSYRWRPDGKAIAYSSNDALPEDREEARKLGFKPIVIDESWVHRSLHVWDREKGASTRLSSDQTVESFEWNPAGTQIVAAMAPRNLVDDSYMFQRLHLVDVDGGGVKKLVDNPGKLGDYAISPDGSRVAYVSAVDRRDPHAGMLYLVEIEGGEVRNLSEGLQGMVHQVEWTSESSLLVAMSRGVRTSLERLDANSLSWSEVWSTQGVAFRGFAKAANADLICAAASTSTHPEELFAMSQGGTPTRMTDSNPWLESIPLGRQETVRYKARDGLEIEGLLMYPVDYKENEAHPMVVVAHGGPESHFSDGWNTSYSRWGQMLCARGYFAWYPNYRASTGRGVAFAKADHGDPMGSEFLDHLDAIDYFVEKGIVDRTRVGIGGGSYGGYTAAWATTRHSQHFAAAVSFVPFVDIRTKWYTSDIPWEFYYVHYEEKWPHEQRDFLSERSPLTYASNCRTPTLLLGGDKDPRVDPSQPFMLYRAIKTATKTPVRYVRYPGEPHGNRTNVYQFDYAVRCLRWFDHYLKEGDQRSVAPPPFDLDYSAWTASD